MKIKQAILWASCLVVLLAWPVRAGAESFGPVIEAYLTGDDSAEQVLLEGGLPAIEALEDRLLEEEALSEEDVRRLVEQLNADTYVDRERASLSLERAGDAVLPLLTRLQGSTESVEARYRLEALLAKLRSNTYDGGLPNLLLTLYEDHLSEVTIIRMSELESAPHDPRGLLFVELAPKEDVIELLEEDDPQQLMLYLLARLYVLHDRAEIGTAFRDFDGEAVLNRATATYWPHELEPLSRTLGRWRATCAARVEGLEAYDVVAFDLEPRLSRPRHGAQQQEPGNEPSLRISNCESSIVWIYLWRYEPPAAGQPIDHKGAGVALSVLGPNAVRLKVVTYIAEDMLLPVVRVSDGEKTFWLTGSALDWAKPFIPAEYLELIRFRNRTYDPVEILSTPE